MEQIISKYISECNALYKAGNATEHSYRPALQTFFESIFNSKHLQIVNEPQRIDCGAPDYVLTDKNIPFAYIEAKDINCNLNDKKYKNQFDRYKKSLDNLIITDYLLFQLYNNGELVVETRIGNTENNKVTPVADNFPKLQELINLFLSASPQTIKTSAELSKQMATKAKLLAEIIETALEEDIKNDINSEIYNQYNSFKSILIDNIKAKEFADLYAQTIAYGMFAAKISDNSTNHFTRFTAATTIPQSNPFLRKMFQSIAGYDLDTRISWIVDALADLFNRVDISKVYAEIWKRNENDPIIHFYEDFLTDYDKKLKKQRGVWYTPQPVVNFIVRAVDDILKAEFTVTDGLADNSKVTFNENEYHKVQILDPATGTGTFLAEIINHTFENFKTNKGMWNNYANEHLIPRLNGFEILMASYSMAHIKLEMLLHENGATINNQRLKIFLTDSLDEDNNKNRAKQQKVDFAKWLTDEANEAAQIKRERPIMIVLGNPPYSGISQNNGKWITDLIDDYKYVDGVHFNERKHWLNDDYVKFIRYGQYFVEKNGEGILAYINNHGFLDNPTFRGMRWHLMKTFDKIFIIDLHGNSKKKEMCSDGSKDENVFDIQQGVSINIFVKTGRKAKGSLAEVYHYDLYGKRNEKYSFLLNNNLQSIQWQSIENKKPYFFFVPKSEKNKEEYEKGFSVNELFKVNVSGIVTMGDNFIIDEDKNVIKNRIIKLKNKEYDELQLNEKFSLGKNYSKWVLQNISRINFDESKFVKINYRPFDTRWTYFDNNLVWRWRKNVMQHFLKNGNIGLIIARQAITDNWSHVQVSNKIIDNRIHYSNKGIPILIPLYLYPETDQLFYKSEKRKPNLCETVISEISQRTGLQFTEEKEETGNTFAPIDVLDYIYAVLHSPMYRERYKEFLKIDFPRIPYPENLEQFENLAKYGNQLRKLHLMENIIIPNKMANFTEEGTNKIENSFTEKSNDYRDKKVYINDKQYFDNVPEIAWNFYIGGYKPAQKWLKDRKDRTLNFDDIKHYQKIIAVLAETEQIMRKID